MKYSKTKTISLSLGDIGTGYIGRSDSGELNGREFSIAQVKTPFTLKRAGLNFKQQVQSHIKNGN